MSEAIQQSPPGLEAVLARLEAILPAVHERHVEHFAQHFPGSQPDTVKVETVGKKFIKLRRGGSVFCFIGAEDGAIYKAASWKVPAKGVRGNIFDNGDVARTMSNPHGSGFYLR
jgi:hypothetical protein